MELQRGKDHDTRLGQGRESQGARRAGLTFRRAAKAGPKVALTSTRSRIQAGSLAWMAREAYRWSRSTMLAKSFWCLMALPGQNGDGSSYYAPPIAQHSGWRDSR